MCLPHILFNIFLVFDHSIDVVAVTVTNHVEVVTKYELLTNIVAELIVSLLLLLLLLHADAWCGVSVVLVARMM